MVNYICGADTEEQAIRMHLRLTYTLDKACLDIGKRSSNNKIIMNVMPNNLHEKKELREENDQTVKALGLDWHSVLIVSRTGLWVNWIQ